MQQWNYKVIDGKNIFTCHLWVFLARLLERVKETGQYTRHIHHQHDQILRSSNGNFNGIQTTRNLLSNENHSLISSHP